jgi:glycosyltransferase involved in cell wall biosynthesis
VAALRIPDFLHRQWREAVDLDYGITPDAGPIFTTPMVRFPLRPTVVEALERIRAEVAGDFSHLVATPWMVRGGADLVAAHLVRAIQQRHGLRAALFLAVDRPERDAADWLPEGTRALYVRDLLPDAAPDDLDILLTQILLQYRPRAVLNVNSLACWRVYERYGRQLAGFSRLYAFLFGYGYTETGARCGPAVDHFRTCLPHLSGLCTDSEFFRRHLIEQNGVVPADRPRVKAIYSPVQDGARAIDLDALVERLGRDRAYRRKVLWASRVAPEKDPAMMLAIVRAMPHIDFVAYGEAVLRVDNPIRDAALPNLDYRGAYTNFFDLPLETFDLFLYTSLFDGLPTVLIAAQTAGLPIVAPGVGGVPEIVNDETGWALPAGATLDDYLRAIEAAAHEPARSRAKAERGLALSRRHRWDTYRATLEAEGLVA